MGQRYSGDSGDAASGWNAPKRGERAGVGTGGCGEGGLGLGAVGVQSVSAEGAWGGGAGGSCHNGIQLVHSRHLGPPSLVDGVSACCISGISGKKPVVLWVLPGEVTS